MRLYQMYDRVARSVVGPIIAEKRDEPAIRSFNTVLANPQTSPGQYPGDFDLLYLGSQDEPSGQLVAALQPEVVATGRAFVETKSSDPSQLQLLKEGVA